MSLWWEGILTLLFIVVGFTIIYFLHKKDKI